jgi:hypothetical protein
VLGKELIVQGRPVYRGVIRFAKDAQRAYNFNRTAAIEALALAPKSPYIAGTSQIKGYENIWKTANTKNHAFLPFDDSRNPSPPQRQAGALVQAGFSQEAMLDSDDMKATTGIYDASLGARSNEQSGKAILARQREGDVNTFAYIDNLSRSIRHAGRILVEMIPKIYDTQRVVRVRFPDSTEDFVEINKTIIDTETGEPVTVHDLSQGKYDVAVDVGPSYTTQRVEAAESMMQFIQAVPNSAPAVMDLLARNMDWPGADEIAERLRKMVPPGLIESEEPVQPPPPTPEQQAEMAKAQATMAKAEADTMKAQADIVKTQAEMAQLGLNQPTSPQMGMEAPGQEELASQGQTPPETGEIPPELLAQLMEGQEFAQ